MKAMVLAAGKGTRLHPFTQHVPKPMIIVGNTPLLEYNINLLKLYDIQEIVINLHYKPLVITDYFGDGEKWGVRITYSYEEELLGTAGAAKKVQSFFDETFILIYGDNLTDCNLVKLVDYHRAKGGIGTVALFERENPTASGIVLLNDENQIIKFLEKPKEHEVFSTLVNAGIYILEPEIFKYIPEGTPYDFGRDLFPDLIGRGEHIFGYRMTEHLMWIDTPQDYSIVQNNITDRRIVQS